MTDDNNVPELPITLIPPHPPLKLTKYVLITSILSLLLVILSLIVSLYVLRLNYDLENTTKNLSQYVAQQARDVERFQAKSIQLDSKVQNLQHWQENWQDHINNTPSHLLKARYYLELAQINAAWSDDKDTSVKLLQEADRLLVSITSQDIFAVRQAIAAEIAQLNAAAPVDMIDLLSRLNVAENSIAKLVLQQPTNANNNPGTNATLPSCDDTTSVYNWRTQWCKTVQLLSKLVVIRRNNDNIAPLLSPLQAESIKERLRMHLMAAQWAILRNNENLYQLELEQAIQGIEQFFALNDSNARALISQLHALQQQHLVTAKPLLGQALKLLNAFIQNTPSSHQEDKTQ